MIIIKKKINKKTKTNKKEKDKTKRKKEKKKNTSAFQCSYLVTRSSGLI